MQNPEFSYKAFISYTSRDSEFVDQLEEWLIHLSEQTNAEQADMRQTFKFFRDSSYSDAGENVEEALKQKLRQSEWLILVCSPHINAYQSSERNWVDFECSYYAHTLNRKDNIVCIISNTAPLGRDISPFYPESIRELRQTLAADMRGNNKWSKEASRIYARITGHKFEDIYQIANKIYWEKQYYETITAAYKKNLNGDNLDALRIMSEIPDKYNPCNIEWNYLKALCSRSAFQDYCGRPDQFAGSQIICFDQFQDNSSYACSTDHKYLYILDCLQAKVTAAIEAHNGNPFRFIYLGERSICTFDNQITVKIWKYDKNQIYLSSQAKIQLPFSKAQPAVFQTFYPDCQLNYMPAVYNHQAQLLAITARNHLFLLNMNTMDCQTIEIPNLKGTLSQLSCVWKNLVFSEHAEMIFLTDEKYLLGWSLNTGHQIFHWNRKRCQPSQHIFGYNQTSFYAENTAHCICIHGKGKKAEWKEHDHTILFFDALPQKQLNSVYTAHQSNDFIILLYEGNTIQVLERAAGTVYSETICIETANTVSDVPQPYCPAVLWYGELWHQPLRQIQKPLYDEKGSCLTGKTVYCDGLTAIATQNRRSIAVYQQQGQLYREIEICSKKQPTMLTDAEMNLPPSNTASELLKAYISQNMDQDMYECSTYAFLDKDHLLIGCTKGYVYLWEIEKNILTKSERMHTKDITIIHIYPQWRRILTADREGTVTIWQYPQDSEGISIEADSSVRTHKNNILTQLLSDHELSVFCNDTGELILYTDPGKDTQKMKTLLSQEAARENQISQIVSLYVTADRSRLVVSRKNQLDFVRLPDGKVLLESSLPDELKELDIDDKEQMMILFLKDRFGHDFIETRYIANLTDAQYYQLLHDRRLHFFS